MIYRGDYLNEISFPLGGIGSGSIGLSGNGSLIDWEIYNRPSKGSTQGYSHFAIKAIDNDKVITRVLNGDKTNELVGRFKNGIYSGYGYGPGVETMAGFPHFRNITFNGEFPIAAIDFEDEDFPAKVRMTAFNPFIPLDDKNSSIPAAFFEFEIFNQCDSDVTYQIAFSLASPYAVGKNTSGKENGISYLTLTNSGVDKASSDYGDLTIATDSSKTVVQNYWYRGRWMDNIVTFWNEFNRVEDLPQRIFEEDGQYDVGTLVAGAKCKANESVKLRFILSWNVPNNYNYWSPYKDENDKDICWKNYYATLFDTSKESAVYSVSNWDSLYSRTLSFKNAIHGMTLDESLIDAITANLAVLKSPTVLRLEDGSFYGWEGVHQTAGSCEGTCQHVWNYAYALCFLFPSLERSIRDAEYKYAIDENGKTEFRLKLPYGRDAGNWRACVDGQMGTVFKTYREWKISGDTEWLRNIWDKAKLALEYAWNDANFDKWDNDKDGVLEGRQHHTLDMELFGPSSWLQSMYFLALKAAAEMAIALGEPDKAEEYLSIYKSGYDWVDKNLFNGSYFVQKIDLGDKSIVDRFNAAYDYWNDEYKEIKYQIKDGSAIDQLLGQWHSEILGLGKVLDEEKIRITLDSMMKNNYKPSLRNHINPWRIFSLNDEAGTLICAYPEGVKQPAISIPYTEETMTGFEYSFAGLLFAYDRIDDGLKVVKAIRDRYDGKKRNPWNEIECGSNYARSMASYSILPILSGFEFDMTKGHIGFDPKVNKDNFKCFWSLDSGYGIYEQDNAKKVVKLIEGSLKLGSFAIYADKVSSVSVDGKPIAYDLKDGILTFDAIVVNQGIEIQL